MSVTSKVSTVFLGRLFIHGTFYRVERGVRKLLAKREGSGGKGREGKGRGEEGRKVLL